MRNRKYQRCVTVDDELWEAAGDVAKELDVSRSEVVRRGIKLMRLRVPGETLAQPKPTNAQPKPTKT